MTTTKRIRLWAIERRLDQMSREAATIRNGLATARDIGTAT